MLAIAGRIEQVDLGIVKKPMKYMPLGAMSQVAHEAPAVPFTFESEFFECLVQISDLCRRGGDAVHSVSSGGQHHLRAAAR